MLANQTLSAFLLLHKLESLINNAEVLVATSSYKFILYVHMYVILIISWIAVQISANPKFLFSTT